MTQTWFPRFEISTMNSSGALLVLGGSPGLQAAPWLAVGASDGNAATDGLLVNDSRDRNQRGNRPPENEAQLQYGLRQIQVRAVRSEGTATGTLRKALRSSRVEAASREQASHCCRWVCSQVWSVEVSPSTRSFAKSCRARRCGFSFMRHLLAKRI